MVAPGVLKDLILDNRLILQKPDTETILAIGKGDTYAFQEVFHAYYENLCQYAFTILKDADEVEDIVQSMFIKIWEKRAELQIQSTIRAYLFKAVYHQCINHLEHRSVKLKHQKHTQYRMQSESQSPEVFPNELEDHVKAAIMELPPQCRTIFMLSRYEELRYAEIAGQLGISVNTVENQVSKALKILRARLKDMVV